MPTNQNRPADVCPDCGHTETHSAMMGCLYASGNVFCDCKTAWKPAPVTQHSLTLADALAQADAAVATVAANVSPDWVAAAESAISHLVAQGQMFTTDDIWDTLADRNTPAPHDPRALGPVMRAAVKSGVVRALGTYVLSRRRHGAPLRAYVGGNA